MRARSEKGRPSATANGRDARSARREVGAKGAPERREWGTDKPKSETLTKKRRWQGVCEWNVSWQRELSEVNVAFE